MTNKMIDNVAAILCIFGIAYLFYLRRKKKKKHLQPAVTRKPESALPPIPRVFKSIHEKIYEEKNGESMALTAVDLKSQMQFAFCQKIREFEQTTGMQVTGMKIKRDEWGKIESVTIKAEMADDEEQ